MIKNAFAPASEHPLLSRLRGGLALGNISYYINDDVFLTRVYLYNYFKFLCDADVPARYTIRCYDRAGKLVATLSGELADTAVIELSEIEGLDAYGVFRTQVIPASRDMFMPQAHASIFFNEYYHPGSLNAVIAHSLHVPTPRHSDIPYDRVSPGVVVPKGFRPYVFIAGGCSFHPAGHPACSSARITVTNERGAERTMDVPPLGPLACTRLDLYAFDPELPAHVGERPFTLRITGKDFLSKPFIFITNGVTTVGEHL